MNVVRAGDRLVTVGERGFALLSDDAGKSWRAVGTPVTRTLTDVAFEDAKQGVAVGHGGSIVRTADGGETWTAVDVEQDAGVDSFLGVASLGGGRFAAYGAFGLYMDSGDHGATWQRRQVISEEFENHISQVLPINGALWMVAEYGTLARSDDGGATWTQLESPYTGSFFGAVVARDGAIVIFGMRGKIFRSADGGSTWQLVETGTTQAFNGGTILSDGRIVLVGNNGMVAESTDNGATFRLAWSPAGRGFASVVEVQGGLVVVGESGAALLDPALLARS
jgi:photosystem II stability/assembly factor-like uncharacterized protein